MKKNYQYSYSFLWLAQRRVNTETDRLEERMNPYNPLSILLGIAFCSVLLAIAFIVLVIITTAIAVANFFLKEKVGADLNSGGDVLKEIVTDTLKLYTYERD